MKTENGILKKFQVTQRRQKKEKREIKNRINRKQTTKNQT